MRVLHLIPSFMGGGAERQLAWLACAQAALGAQVHVGYIYAGENLGRMAEAPVHHHMIPARSNYDPALVPHVFKLVRSVRPRIVQTWLFQMDVLGGTVARLMRMPWVLSERSSAAMYRNSPRFSLRQKLGSGASAIVANSIAGRDYWLQAGVRCPVEVIRNVVPVAHLEALATRKDPLALIPDGTRMILVAGRYSPEKNLGVTLHAVGKVLESRPDVHSVCFGEGPQEQEIRLLAARLSASDRVHVLPYTEFLPYWMRRASVYVSMSRYEGSPNAVLEAMTLRCPVVVSDIPEHREILDESRGLLASPDSISEVTQSLAAVLDQDREAASRAEKARATVMRWTPEAIAERYLTSYERILAARRTRA